jgi:hypothetical protein
MGAKIVDLENKNSEELVNPIKGKYEIDLSTEGKIIVTNVWNANRSDENSDDNRLEINVPTDYSLTQPYIVNFSRMADDKGSLSGKYVMYTDINGVSSEVFVDAKDLKENDKIKNIILDTDYLFFVFAEGKEGEEKPVYIQLDAISGSADKKRGNYVNTDTENV